MVSQTSRWFLSLRENSLPLVALVSILAGCLVLPGVGLQVSAQSGEELYFLAGSMPSGRKMMGAAAVGDHLYVISGSEDPEGYVTTVTRGTIGPDGMLSDWTLANPLPVNRSYIGNCTLAQHGVIYVAGGNVHNESGPGSGISAKDVTMARVYPDGTLSGWINSQPFPGPPVQCNAAVATATHLYVLGGADDNNIPQNVVYRAAFMADGTLGPWSNEPPLPVACWFHSAAYIGDRIVVWGGVTTSGDRIGTTYSAPITPNGAIGQWREEQPLPYGLTHAQAMAVPPFIVNFAGMKADRTANEAILFNMLTTSGLTGWQPVLLSLPITRYASGCYDPIRSIIYIVGGSTGVTLTDGQASPNVYGFRVLGESGSNSGSAAEARPSSGVTATSVSAVNVPAPPPNTPEVAWFQDDIVGAFQEAKRQNKPLLIVFGSPKSPQSSRFWNDVCMHRSFKIVGQKYVCVVLNADNQRSVAMRLGVFKLPAVVLVNTQGGIIKSEQGDNLDIAKMMTF